MVQERVIEKFLPFLGNHVITELFKSYTIFKIVGLG